MRSVSLGAAPADEDRRCLLVLEQADAPQDEGAHDDLGDVGLGGQQAAKLGAAGADHLSGRRHPTADQILAVAEQIELAGELIRRRAS